MDQWSLVEVAPLLAVPGHDFGLDEALEACRVRSVGAGVVDFVIAYESRHASSVAGSRDIECVEIGQDTLLPVSKAGPDGRPIFDFRRKGSGPLPYLCFGATAPISRHIDPLLTARGLHGRLQVVYEDAMAGALRIRVREGIGIAWLPKSLVAPDLEAGHLTPIGGRTSQVAVEIKILRLRRHGNAETNSIWAFLQRHEGKPLLGEI